MSASKKQAVVLIHGIGEQVPMDTLRGFVDAVWTRDPTVRPPTVPSTAWSKPDDVSENYELRRLTTAENHKGQRTDFFEFYWADLLTDTTVTHVTAWIKVLLWRRPSRVPSQLRGIWWSLVLLTIALLAGAVIYQFKLIPQPKWLMPMLGAFGVALWLMIGGFLIKYAGDAARYLHVAPPNIGARRAIRDAGIKLLQKLHDSQKYDRIVIVGHSLGSVIGYDVLTHLWPRFHVQHAASSSSVEAPKLQTAEALADAAPSRKIIFSDNQEDEAALSEYTDQVQSAATAYLQEIQRHGSKWLVTDFVTMGSPLAHAAVLMARNETEFEMKKDAREFPTCPPTLEMIEGKKRFSFKSGSVWMPHHAAVFAATRWTNLYFPCQATLWGDVIGGPVAPAFGLGVRDVKVTTSIWRGMLNHTHYWRFPGFANGSPPDHITALRQTIGIG